MGGARRSGVGGGLALALLGKVAWATEGTTMWGMIGKIKAHPGQRAALAAILTAGSGTMPGCLAYIVSEDLADADALWVTEYWDSKASHDASLSLPVVKDAIAKGRPLLAGFEGGGELGPISGVGR